jgi:hypothetical protein
MHDRTALGVVDLPAGEFAAAVDALFDRPVQVLASHAEMAPYDLPALTTAGRFWVHGIARTDTGLQDFAFFVKHVQTPVRSPLFATVPDALRDFAAATVPNRSVPGLGRRDVRAYADGRVAHVVVPMLMGDAVWAHPLVADAFELPLRDALRTAAGRVRDIVAELEQLPFGNAHGDACTRNLLRSECSDDIVLIDFAFWGTAPLGLDLGQLVLGEVQLGERDAACLPAVEHACLPAYVAGIRDEGSDVPEAVVRRGHALLMLLFSGLSAVPFEHLDRPATPELRRLFHARAACARFILELVASTS